ncbi:hypothetical protein BANRA_02443 [Klebsiella pneumoniae]|uniref:Uncharacterized protein n=1 Tax=Klebsiella pneumoniae TaxID=573 RepID=A0ABD7UIS9_KLEPN|nr:hypothetical protein BANRA_02443 [Klebsiella pneumoniae]
MIHSCPAPHCCSQSARIARNVLLVVTFTPPAFRERQPSRSPISAQGIALVISSWPRGERQRKTRYRSAPSLPEPTTSSGEHSHVSLLIISPLSLSTLGVIQYRPSLRLSTRGFSSSPGSGFGSLFHRQIYHNTFPALGLFSEPWKYIRPVLFWLGLKHTVKQASLFHIRQRQFGSNDTHLSL